MMIHRTLLDFLSRGTWVGTEPGQLTLAKIQRPRAGGNTGYVRGIFYKLFSSTLKERPFTSTALGPLFSTPLDQTSGSWIIRSGTNAFSWCKNQNYSHPFTCARWFGYGSRTTNVSSANTGNIHKWSAADRCVETFRSIADRKRF